MRFLSLVDHLLPVLALGGLVSGKEISTERLHRSYDDEVYNLSEELSENNHLNPGYSREDPSESQSTTISSISTTVGQPLLSFTLNEEGLDRTVGENLISTTQQTDNFSGVTAKQFSDETDRNVSDGTTEAIGNHDQTTEFLHIMWTSLNITHNQQRLADLGTAITANDSKPEGWKNFTPDGDVAPADSNDERKSGVRKTNPDVQSTVEAIIDPISNTEASVKSNSISNADDVSAYNEPIHNQNSKPAEATESDFKLSERIFEKSADTVAAQLPDRTEYNSSRGRYFEMLNDGYVTDDPKPGEDMKNEKFADTSEEISRTGTTENWLSVLQSIVPSDRGRLDFDKKMLQSIHNTVSNSNVNHNVMSNAPTVPCPCSTPPASSNLYPSPHSLSPSIPVPELPPGVPIESDLPEEYRGFEIEPKSRYIDDDDVKKQNLRGSHQFLHPLVTWGIQPVEKYYTPIIQIKGDIILHGESQPTSVARKCFKIAVKKRPICRRGKSICYSPCSGCKSLCKAGRIICREDPSQRPKMELVCKVIWRPISWPGIIIYPAQSYDASYRELFDEQRGLLRDSKQDSLTLEADGYEHEILRLETSPNAVSFEQVSESLSEADDRGSDDEGDSAVSQQLFIEAIREAIIQSPVILPPELIGKLTPEGVQELESVPVDNSAMEIANPFRNPVGPKASGEGQSRKNDNEIEKLFVVNLEMLPEPAIKEETKPSNRPKMASIRANQKVNTNVNANQNVNFSGNIAAQQPLLPDIQVPIISPVIKPPISLEPGPANGNLNTNAGVNMNLNINQNHNANVGHSKRLLIQLIITPEPAQATQTPHVELNIPISEYGTPLESTVDIAKVTKNANVNVNSNINPHHNLNNQIRLPLQPKTEVSAAYINPKIEQPTVLKFHPEILLGPAYHFEQNVNSNANMKDNNIANHHIQIPKAPQITNLENTVVDKIHIMLPDIMPPFIEKGNQNADVNLNLNFTNIKKNIKENREPSISKVTENIPVIIPEPVQVADPLIGSSVPIYKVPLLPASSSTLNFDSNMDHLNSNVNLDIINEMNKSVIEEQQRSLTEPINQPTSAPTVSSSEAVSELSSIHEAADSIIRANQNINKNSNINSEQNVNQDAPTNQDTPETPETLPVSLEYVPIHTTVNVPALNGNENRNSNINQNVNRIVNMNSNVNMNSGYNAGMNVPRTPSPGSPALIPGPRPVAVVPEFALTGVAPAAPVSSQVSRNQNVNSNANMNYNSNMNNDVNHKIVVPSEQLVSPVIKPVESQPVAAPNHSEILPLIPSQVDVNQNLNANSNVNNNVNVNTKVNGDYNMNGNASNADYKIDEREVLEPPKIAEISVMVPRFPDLVVTKDPVPEQVAILRPNENTELNNKQNVNANINYSSNVKVDQNFNLNGNGNIEGQRITSMPILPATVSIREPILLPHPSQALLFSHAPIVESEIPQNGNSNGNYNANVKINHNLNSNADYNQANRIRPEPILFPPLPPLPWAQELQPQINTNFGMNLIDNSEVNFNQNSIPNLNRNVSLSDDHVIVSREPNAIAEADEYSNKDYYASISKAEVKEPVAIDAANLVLAGEKESMSLVTRDSQVNANQNAKVNMNYNSNYNNNANYNSKAVANENENGKLPLIKPAQNVLASVIVPQSQEDRGTGLWNVRKNSNVNANYNSNMNYNANVNANSNYNSNLDQSGLGVSAQGYGGTRENRRGIQDPIFTGNPVLPASMISNTVIGLESNSGHFGHDADQNFASNADSNSKLNSEVNSNVNFIRNADYNAQLRINPKNPKTEGWYELWYNNGRDKDGWTEIWNNKQFKKFLDEQLKAIKQQGNEHLAKAQAQASALIR